MTKNELLKKIADTLNIKQDDLMTAIASDNEAEVNVTIPDGNFWDEETLKTRIDNERRAGYTDGKKAGVEMEVKELRDNLGLEFEGKTVSNLIDAYKKHIEEDLKIEPNKKLSEKDQIIETLKQNIANIEKEKEQVLGQAKEYQLNSQLMDSINGQLADGWSKDDVISLFKAKYQIVEEDGQMVVKQGDKVIRNDKTQEPISYKDLVSDFVTQKNLIKQDNPTPPPGRGGTDDPGKGKGVMDISQISDKNTYNEYIKTNDIQGNKEFEILNQLAKEKPEVLEAINKA